MPVRARLLTCGKDFPATTRAWTWGLVQPARSWRLPYKHTVYCFRFRRPDALAMLPPYAELHCLSNFSFLRGASHPEELVERAQALGYAALALTDECSVAGVVRAHLAAKDAGLKFVVGSEFTLADGLKLALYATDRATYGDLAQLITRGRRNATKGSYALTRDDVAATGAAVPGAMDSAHGRRISGRRRALVRRHLRGPRVDRGGTARTLRRSRAAHPPAGAFPRDRPAAGRGRRRAHARAGTTGPAGHADRHPPAHAAHRMRLRASSATASGTCARARAWPRSIRAN